MLSSKPLGYLRMLITAWMFGTSAGMDAFHMAGSIVALFAGTISSAMESAVLPELERLRSGEGGPEASRSLFALVTWIVLFLVALLCAAFAIAPGVLIRFFASGFDDERIRIGAAMLWWLTPFAVVTMLRPLLEVWAMFRERYTLSSISGSIFNFIAIPALLLSAPAIGVYAVAFSMSLGHLCTLLLFFFALGGLPLAWKGSAALRRSLAQVLQNATFAMVLVGAGTLLTVVDKYFASRLPEGSVAAISYAGSIVGILALLISNPLGFFLAKISRAVAEAPAEASRMAQQAISLVAAYFMPVALLTAAVSTSLISLIYGWGSFDARSVQMTALVLTAYLPGTLFAIMASVVHRYAQAKQKLGTIAAMAYVLIAFNALLDWLFVNRWGLAGLAWATSITQCTTFVVYYAVVVRGSLPGYLLQTRFFQQLLLVLAAGAVVHGCLRFGPVVQLLAAAVIGPTVLFLAERLHLLPGVPEHWRPRALAGFLAASAASFFHGARP